MFHISDPYVNISIINILQRVNLRCVASVFSFRMFRISYACYVLFCINTWKLTWLSCSLTIQQVLGLIFPRYILLSKFNFTLVYVLFFFGEPEKTLCLITIQQLVKAVLDFSAYTFLVIKFPFLEMVQTAMLSVYVSMIV